MDYERDPQYSAEERRRVAEMIRAEPIPPMPESTDRFMARMDREREKEARLYRWITCDSYSREAPPDGAGMQRLSTGHWTGKGGTGGRITILRHGEGDVYEHRAGREKPWRRLVGTRIEMLTREERRRRLKAGELPGGGRPETPQNEARPPDRTREPLS